MTDIRDFQKRVAAWVSTALTGQVFDVKLRAARFLEEAIEAAQSAGVHPDDVKVIFDQVYQRPPGRLFQELGGCMATLCALATSAHQDLEVASLAEIKRMETPEMIEKIRRRQIDKVTPR